MGSPVGENWGPQWELQQGSILLELPPHVVDCSVAGLQVDASGTSQKTRGRDGGGKHQSIRDLLVYVYLPGAYVSSFFIHGGSSTACFSYCRIRRIHLGRSKTFDII